MSILIFPKWPLLLCLHFALGQLDISKVDTLVHELSAIGEKWLLIGQALRVTVEDIKYSQPADCLREVLKRRLHGGITTWGRMIAVLRNVEASDLADQLKAKYIPGESTIIVLLI